MLIAYDTPGQLGNQLWAYSNLIATGKNCNVTVVIILQQNYFKLLHPNALNDAKKQRIYIFNSTSYTARTIKKISTHFVKNPNSIIAKMFSVQLALKGTLEENSAIIKQKNKLHLVNTWQHRVFKDFFYEQSDFVKSIIQPDNESKKLAEEKILLLRKEYDIIVAVHIRRGDYKTFLDGKFYFEDEIYQNKMQHISNALGHAKVVFAIFSNEKINVDHFKNLHVSFNNNNTPIGDMWGISLCDYIIGPISTFSMWASFWQNVPLLFIEKSTVIHSMEIFSPVIAQDVQQNGIVRF